MHKLFPSQIENEKIYLVVRAHWVTLFVKILVWFLAASALFVFKKFGPEYFPGFFEGYFFPITSLFMEIYVLLLCLSLFLIWVIYYLNIQIITDRRIVDIDQVGLFSRTVSELHIENIEDVTSETKGLFGTLFNFGMVYVQTAGSKERFEFELVPNSGAIEKLILDIYESIPHVQRKAQE